MPKICNKTTRVSSQDTSRVFDTSIFYDVKNKYFYIECPIELLNFIELLSQSDCIEYAVFKLKGKMVFTGESEVKCEANAIKGIRHLMSLSVSKTNVIAIYYSDCTDAGIPYFSFDENFNKIGLNYGLAFLEEITSGDVKKYVKYNKYKVNGEISVAKRDVSWFENSPIVVIPDTEENRAKLIQLYNAILELKSKLNVFFKTQESVLGFINSSTKLLN